MSNIDQVNAKIESLEILIVDKQTEIDNKQSEIDDFEFECDESEFDDYLDNCEESVTICGMEFLPSDILKNCDPTAYRCAKSDYESNYDLDSCEEYNDLKDELEELESELEDLESELAELQDDLDELENELEDELNDE